MTWAIICIFSGIQFGKMIECDDVWVTSTGRALQCMKKTTLGSEYVGLFPVDSCYAKKQK